MELGFVLSALRRRWWIVLITTVVFGVLASTLSGGTVEQYQSQSVLLVQPNTRNGQVQSFGEASRYVQGQMAAMESATFQGRVAQRAGGDITADDVDEAVTLTNEPNTDVVTIDVFTEAPDRSQSIAQAFVDTYILDLTNETSDSVTTTIDDVETQVGSLQTQLNGVNERLALALRPFLSDLADGATVNETAIAPALTSERDQLMAEIDELVTARIELQRGDGVQVNSKILQDASRPTSPIVDSPLLQTVAGILGGFGLGCLIALMWNRFSAKVADEAMVSEILGLPIAGTVPPARGLAKLPISALTDPPEPLRGQIQRIAVAAEAQGPVDRPTRVVVVGAQRGAGTTTLAMLVAHEFISSDATVALVDADPKSSRLTEIVGSTNATFDDLVHVDLDRMASEAVLIGPTTPAGRLRRGEIEPFFDALAKSTRIVVVDGGSVLSAATTVDLCYAADVVILAVPTRRQNIAALQAVGRAVTRSDVMVVTTSPRGRSAGSDTKLPERRGDLTGTIDAPADDEYRLTATDKSSKADKAPKGDKARSTDSVSR